MKKLILVIALLTVWLDANAEYQFKNFILTHEKDLAHKYSRDKEGLSPMMSKVKDFIKMVGREAIQAIADDLLDYTHEHTLGRFNSPILNYESGLQGELGLKISRRVDPLFGTEQWRVMDRLTVTVGARAFLKKLRDSGEILITDARLNLFAGVVFKRTYAHDHYANSYKDGLTKNFDKLLLGFYNFIWLNFLDIPEGEQIAKTDEISIGAELASTTPSFYFINAYGDATVYFNKLNTISYFKPSEELQSNEKDYLRAARTITKMVGSNVQVGVQLDFFQLLRITLLGMEYDINYSKDQVTNLTFSKKDTIDIKTEEKLSDAIKAINKNGNPKNFPVLKNYTTSIEVGNRLREELNLFGAIWGKHIGTFTEKMTLTSQGKKYYFYRHINEQANIKKSFWNIVFGSRKIGKFSKRTIKNMTLEFMSERETDFKDIEIADPNLISFRVNKEYYAKKDRSKFRRQASKIIQEFEEVDGGIIQGLEKGELRAPFVLNTHAQVGAFGIKQFVEMDSEGLITSFKAVCTGVYEQAMRLKRKDRRCVKRLTKLFEKSLRSDDETTRIHVKSFKAFLKYLTKKIHSFKALKVVFGDKNVHLLGNFTALTDDGRPFRTYFESGEFQGNGVIKDFVINQ